ncbi:thiamine phosphate synthase [Chitinivibrio alkaliphilus]|uniref:thiamine phosphate synthase n=1 Tax=Chitinivibrio alkaliphilus TaxID=1505232 RepID=UPI00138B0FA3|nr:thiamine phosphate synthase [Chitinivibrio alkaliphilus]
MIVAISKETSFAEEASLITALLRAGLSRYHIRKPNVSTESVAHLLRALPRETYPHISVHGKADLLPLFPDISLHLTGRDVKDGKKGRSASCHTFREVSVLEHSMEYLFLSPMRDSISKKGYEQQFDDASVQDFLRRKRSAALIALGGITSAHIPSMASLGFNGVALMGALWTAPNPLEAFLECQDVYLRYSWKDYGGRHVRIPD